MRNIFNKSIMIVSFGILALACDDKLNLEPQQNVDTQDQLSTLEGISNFMNGVYAHIAGQTTTVYGGELYGSDFNLISELMGADRELAWSGTFRQYGDIWNRQPVEDNLVVTNNWIRAYEAINMCNLILENVDVLEGQQKNSIQGEALSIRSLLFFELVRFYALPYRTDLNNSHLGIPLVTTANTQLSDIDEEDFVSRSTVAAVYSRIIEDLNTAVGLLQPTNGPRFARYAALGILSRVYLQMGDYEGARDVANRVIEEGARRQNEEGSNVGYYELTADYSRAFNNSSPSGEDIFAIQQSSLFNAGTSNSGLTTFYANSDQSGRDGDIDILPAHLALYEAGDVRGEFFYAGIGDGLPKTSKWLVEYAAIPVIRLAEMYLTRAEANLRLGTAVGATPLEDLNRIRNRAGLADFEETLTVEEILQERRRELAFEGQRLHDLKRTQQSVSGEPYTSTSLVLPIPRRELDNNSNLDPKNEY